jgi:hypothetical protein
VGSIVTKLYADTLVKCGKALGKEVVIQKASDPDMFYIKEIEI